jgi:P4 family phage/plasmid primase-like protien
MSDDQDGNFFVPKPPKPAKPKRQPRPMPEPVSYINGEAEPIDAMPPEFSEDSLGLRFSAIYGHALKWVNDWGKWMSWDGCVWRQDRILSVFDLVRRMVRVKATEADDAQTRARLAAASTVAAIEKLVRSDRRHAREADAWDSNPWLLNTPSGIVNLETGEIGPHDPACLMTKCTGVAPLWIGERPDPLVDYCPQWTMFLARVTGGDPLLQAYLKRVAGYWLTGLTQEHAMWFFYGTGRNGKGVFLNTLTRIMGDYAMVASPDTFTQDGHGKHLTVLARLQGARLVVSQETEEGVPWAEARIKAVTGGDPITANFMHKDPFTFLPNFKLGISGNHKPGLRSVDQAIRARFNLVPFTVTIPVTERDPGLSEKLWAEAPAILSWAIEGCHDWRHGRLAPPTKVTAATEEYFDQEDSIALWIAECCDTGPTCEGLSAALFKSWTAWALQAGEKAGSNKAFTSVLEKHGFPPGKHSRNGRLINGIRIHVEPDPREPAHERE